MESKHRSPETPSEPYASLLLDQREANEHLALAALHAREEAEDAHSGRILAEDESDALRAAAQLSQRLLGSVGHHLRNPLSTIFVAAELLAAPDLPAERRVWLARSIIESGQRMGRMLDQLSSFTQGRVRGALELTLAPCDLSRTCWNVVEEMRVISVRPIVLRTEGDLRGSWDEARLSQVLSSLVGNALDLAVPTAGVTVRGRREGNWAIVEVETENASLLEGVAQSLFSALRSDGPPGPDATSHVRLGLFISREVALSHDGSLEAQCDAGKVTFVLRLPCP